MSWETMTATVKFQKAVLSNDVRMAESCIEQTNANSYFQHQQELPLHLSVKCGHLAMVDFLLRNGADVNMMNKNGMYPLHYACLYFQSDIAKTLIMAGANLDCYSVNGGQTPLLIAVNSNSLELIKILVESGANLESEDLFDGHTPLHLACRNNNLAMAEYFISKGANVQVENRLGFTPLMTTITTNYNINVQMVKLLLRNGANPNQANKFGITPLLATIRRSSDHFEEGAETVQLLIDHGCQVDDRESTFGATVCIDGNQNNPQIRRFGDTALNISIDRNQDTITEKLIHHGADVSIRNLRGESPLINLLRDRKYSLAKKAMATMKTIEPELQPQIQRYLSSEYHQNLEDPDSVEQLKKFLETETTAANNYFPRLMHLCRCSIRRWLGRHADCIIWNFNFPQQIKMYLLLKQL